MEKQIFVHSYYFYSLIVGQTYTSTSEIDNIEAMQVIKCTLANVVAPQQ